MVDSKLNYELALTKSEGEDCMICLREIAKGESCVKLKIKKVKILLITSSADERTHLACAAELHHDLNEVLQAALQTEKKKDEKGQK